MIKIVTEMHLRDFDAWSVSIDTKNKIIEAGKDLEFEDIINAIYPDGLTDTQLNDLLWFDDEWCYETLGMEVDDE